jgi:hypothetical protein
MFEKLWRAAAAAGLSAAVFFHPKDAGSDEALRKK